MYTSHTEVVLLPSWQTWLHIFTAVLFAVVIGGLTVSAFWVYALSKATQKISRQ